MEDKTGISYLTFKSIEEHHKLLMCDLDDFIAHIRDYQGLGNDWFPTDERHLRRIVLAVLELSLDIAVARRELSTIVDRRTV